jgi:hypothetical protein
MAVSHLRQTQTYGNNLRVIGGLFSTGGHSEGVQYKSNKFIFLIKSGSGSICSTLISGYFY